MSKFGEELIESMQQAATHAGGRKVSGMRVTTVKIPDVKAIRKALVSVREQFESYESFMIQEWWPDSSRVTDVDSAESQTLRPQFIKIPE